MLPAISWLAALLVTFQSGPARAETGLTRTLVEKLLKKPVTYPEKTPATKAQEAPRRAVRLHYKEDPSEEAGVLTPGREGHFDRVGPALKREGSAVVFDTWPTRGSFAPTSSPPASEAGSGPRSPSSFDDQKKHPCNYRIEFANDEQARAFAQFWESGQSNALLAGGRTPADYRKVRQHTNYFAVWNSTVQWRPEDLYLILDGKDDTPIPLPVAAENLARGRAPESGVSPSHQGIATVTQALNQLRQATGGPAQAERGGTVFHSASPSEPKRSTEPNPSLLSEEKPAVAGARAGAGAAQN